MPLNGGWRAEETVYVSIWAWNGVWTRLQQVTIYASTTVGGGGLQSIGWSRSITVNAPAGTTIMRVTYDDSAMHYGGDVRTIQLNWQTTSSSGTRSATPNGETVTATVRPQ